MVTDSAQKIDSNVNRSFITIARQLETVLKRCQILESSVQELQPLKSEVEGKLNAEALNMLATKSELSLFNSKLAGKVDMAIVRDHENRLMDISSVI